MDKSISQIKEIGDKTIGLVLFKYHKIPKEWVVDGDVKTGYKLKLTIDKELARVSKNDLYGAIYISPAIDMDNASAEVRDNIHSELRAVLSSIKGKVSKGDKVLNLHPEKGDDNIIRSAGLIPVNIN